MRYYHRTTARTAMAILARGFKDAGSYMTRNTYKGVWISDRPLDANEGALGDVLPSVDAAARAIAPYEWIEEGKGFREFLVPAALLNRIGRVRVQDAPESFTAAPTRRDAFKEGRHHRLGRCL